MRNVLLLEPALAGVAVRTAAADEDVAGERLGGAEGVSGAIGCAMDLAGGDERGVRAHICPGGRRCLCSRVNEG